MNSYELTRAFFNWSFENPEKITPNHVAIYFFAIEHCNRLGWKEKFGFPTTMAKDAIGISKHQTFIKYFNELVEWGWIKLIQKSTNQYSANIISLVNAMPKSGKALDKALIKHGAKQHESMGQSNSPIDKQDTKEQGTRNKEQVFTPPTLDEFKQYFIENKYPSELAERVYKGYDVANWHKANGNPIKNWKQTCQQVWFKPDNLNFKPQTNEDTRPKSKVL